MADIIKLDDHIIGLTVLHDGGTSDNQFLVDEGLDLLVAYRSISDRSIRLALKELVERVAKKENP
jgi:hypothetical protein